MIFRFPLRFSLAYTMLRRYADSVHKKFPLPVSTFHLCSVSLSDYRVQCICLPASWKYTLIYWLSKHASSYGALLSAAHPHGATLLADASPHSLPSRSLPGVFSAFSSKRIALPSLLTRRFRRFLTLPTRELARSLALTSSRKYSGDLASNPDPFSATVIYLRQGY